MTRRWAPPIRYTLRRIIASIMKDLIWRKSFARSSFQDTAFPLRTSILFLWCLFFQEQAKIDTRKLNMRKSKFSLRHSPYPRSRAGRVPFPRIRFDAVFVVRLSSIEHDDVIGGGERHVRSSVGNWRLNWNKRSISKGVGRGKLRALTKLENITDTHQATAGGGWEHRLVISNYGQSILQQD